MINLNKGSGQGSMQGKIYTSFRRDILLNVRISSWEGSGLGTTRNSASRDNVKTSASFLAKIKEIIYTKGANKEPGTWSRRLINISSFHFSS